MSPLPRLVWFAALALLAASGCDAAGAEDAGQPDGGGVDAGRAEAGPADAAPADAAPADADSRDSGSPDAGQPDGGVLDAGPIDAALADGGSLDGGPSDAGPSDAGPVGGDSGPSDGGFDAGRDGGSDAGPALPTCDGLAATIECVAGVLCMGTSIDDVIVGTAGDDEIHGQGGNDVICGAGGDDSIDGDGGHDVIHGGAGADVVRGGNGWDRVYGGAGGDTLEGGAGVDLLVGEDGDDTIDGGADADLIEGNAGHDTIRGGFGVDYCFDASTDTVAASGPDTCEYLLRAVSTVEYAAHRIDGVATPLLADLYECESSGSNCRDPLPEDAPILYAHGGGFRLGSRLDLNPRLYAAQLASMGFRVMNIDYRTVGPGSGHTFDPADLTPWGQAVWTDALAGRTEAPLLRSTMTCADATDAQRGAFRIAVLAAIEDVLTAAEFARGLYGLAGGAPLVLAGSSAGAISSFYASYAVDDLEAFIAPGVRRGAPNVLAVVAFWGGFYPTRCAMNMDAGWMESGESALYVVHGEADLSVDATYSRAAVERATAVDLEVVARFLPDAGHGFPATDVLDYDNSDVREAVRVRAFLAGLAP